MGRDIYGFIERKTKDNAWELLAHSEQLRLARYNELFRFLTYYALDGKTGVRQRPLRSWCATVSPVVRRELFYRCEKDISGIPSLLDKADFDYKDFKATIGNETFKEDDIKGDYKEGLSFSLAPGIMSCPDFCFWNICTADELEWALNQAAKASVEAPEMETEYREALLLMREQESAGFECRFVYVYDFATSWIFERPYLD